MHIELIEIRGGELVALHLGDDLFTGAHVPLDALPSAERAWFAKLAVAAQAGDARSAALLIEASEGILMIDAAAVGLARRKGDSPA